MRKAGACRPRSSRRFGVELATGPLIRLAAKRCMQPRHRDSDVAARPVLNIEPRQLGLCGEKLYPAACGVSRDELQYHTRDRRRSGDAVERPEPIDAAGTLGRGKGATPAAASASCRIGLIGSSISIDKPGGERYKTRNPQPRPTPPPAQPEWAAAY